MKMENKFIKKWNKLSEDKQEDVVMKLCDKVWDVVKKDYHVSIFKAIEKVFDSYGMFEGVNRDLVWDGVAQEIDEDKIESLYEYVKAYIDSIQFLAGAEEEF